MKLASLFSKKTAGANAERVAEIYLQQHGLKTIARNYQCRFGEIDLVMQDGEITAFVEVRYRASQHFGGAAASIHVAKQRRIIAAAEHYLSGIRHAPPCRFDAILMNKIDAASVEWIKDAFGA
ncbi:MAG: YraN family protein [Pseudomonadota bacterium]